MEGRWALGRSTCARKTYLSGERDLLRRREPELLEDELDEEDDDEERERER